MGSDSSLRLVKRVPLSRVLPGILAAGSGEAEAEVAKVMFPSQDFLEQLARNPDVRDWLISVTELPKVRREYLEHLGRFLQWTQWTPNRMLEIKKAALKEGEPFSQVETMIKRYHEALRIQGYAGNTRTKHIAVLYSFIESKGFTIPKKLVHLDIANQSVMRVPKQQEVELFLQYAPTLPQKLVYTLMTETPCRPRVFPAIRWNWLEPEWWTGDVVQVLLPREFRPANQGAKKFEPICFLGPKSINLLKQLRDAKIKAGKVPLETDKILPFNGPALLAVVHRDYEGLVKLNLIRASRADEKGKPIEQPITPKSWRKYQFNIIDSLTEISTEWRKMLKGRDLDTEKYYSETNVEALRTIYRDKIWPKLWSDTSTHETKHEMETLRGELKQVKDDLATVLKMTGLRIKSHGLQ